MRVYFIRGILRAVLYLWSDKSPSTDSWAFQNRFCRSLVPSRQMTGLGHEDPVQVVDAERLLCDEKEDRCPNTSERARCAESAIGGESTAAISVTQQGENSNRRNPYSGARRAFVALASAIARLLGAVNVGFGA